MDRMTFAPAERPACSVAGCRRRALVVGRRLCEYHYVLARRESYPACAFPGCGQRSCTRTPARGAAGPGAVLCHGHYQQWKKRGERPGSLDGLRPLRRVRQYARAPGDRLTPELAGLPAPARRTKADYRREFAYGECAFAGCGRAAETRKPFSHRPGHPDEPGPGVVLCPGHRRQFGLVGDLALLRPLAWTREPVEAGAHPAKGAFTGRIRSPLATCRTDGCQRPPVGRLDTCQKCYDRARREVGYGRECEAAGCSRPSVTVGPTSGSGARLCAGHASMWQRKGGDPRGLPPIAEHGGPRPVCMYPECGRPAGTRHPSKAVGGHLLCVAHAAQYRRASRRRMDPLASLHPLRARRKPREAARSRAKPREAARSRAKPPNGRLRWLRWLRWLRNRGRRRGRSLRRPRMRRAAVQPAPAPSPDAPSRQLAGALACVTCPGGSRTRRPGRRRRPTGR